MRGQGLGSQSSDPDLLVAVCTCTKQTAWTEDQFTVTAKAGIRKHEKRVAEIVVRDLKRAKPDTWGCVQTRGDWICKFGTVPGSMRCVEKEFELQDRKWEEYRGTRFNDGDSTLVVELWLHRVTDDLSGLTFQEWDPSSGSDDTSAPVTILVKSTDLCAADFHLVEVRPLQLDTVSHGHRRTYVGVVRKIQGVGNVCTLRAKRQ